MTTEEFNTLRQQIQQFGAIGPEARSKIRQTMSDLVVTLMTEQRQPTSEEQNLLDEFRKATYFTWYPEDIKVLPTESPHATPTHH